MNKVFERYTLLLIGMLAFFGVSIQFIISIMRAIAEDNSVGEVVINMWLISPFLQIPLLLLCLLLWVYCLIL